jgi:hypothetical protein
MIAIDFKFNESVEPKDQYILTVTYGHGPAEVQTETSFKYDSTDVDQLKLDILSVITSQNANADVDDTVDDVIAILENQGVEDAYDAGDEWRNRFYEDDIATGLCAKILGYYVVYYSDAGIKHDVQVLINGRATITRSKRQPLSL